MPLLSKISRIVVVSEQRRTCCCLRSRVLYIDMFGCFSRIFVLSKKGGINKDYRLYNKILLEKVSVLC